MVEQSFANSIHNYGSISILKNTADKKIAINQECTTEDYVGKIITIFLPYLRQNISDGKIISVQDELKKIITEVKEK